MSIIPAARPAFLRSARLSRWRRRLPFEPMWNVARGGPARVGEMAPDFTLPTVDRKSRV